MTTTIAASLAASADADAPDFDRDVAPILKEKCWKCHGNEARKAELDLRTPDLMREEDENGPVIKEGPLSESLLFEKVRDGAMPPDGEPRLLLEEIEVLRRWIAAGDPAGIFDRAAELKNAPLVSDSDREYYAFRRLMRPDFPQVSHPSRVRTSIDVFLLARLQQENLDFSQDADRQTLVRRVFLI